MAPTRTCIGCRKALPADALFRVVREADGGLVIDRRGPGRGAWLCQGSPSCLSAAIRRHAFERAFKAPVAAEAIAALTARLDGASEQAAPDVRG